MFSCLVVKMYFHGDYCKNPIICIGQITVEQKTFTTETRSFAFVFLSGFVSPWFKKCSTHC